MEVPIEGLRVPGRTYRASSPRRLLVVSVFLALYAIVIPYCYRTAGEPRAAAAIAAQEKSDEKWRQYSDGNFTADAEADIDFAALAKGNGVLGMGNKAHKKASNDKSVSLDELRASEEAMRIGEFEKEDLIISSFGGSNNATSSSGFFSGWFSASKEQKRAEAEQERLIKEFNERSEDGPMSLPPTYLPSAWACLALFATLSLHALFHLMCYWQVAFKAFTLYSPCSKVDGGTFVVVTPPENRGKAEFVAVKHSSLTGNYQVEFQRQTYMFTPAEKLGASGAKRFPNGVFSLFTCPIDKPLTFYTSSLGIRSQSDVMKTLERWGKNHLSLQRPSFKQMLIAQLLSPLAIFQVFCAMLWLLDEYWSYTVWTLVSVVVMEATTVFQRNRTQNMLGGMAPQASPIYVFRSNVWSLVSTKDILPGDLLSIAFKAVRSKKKTALSATEGMSETEAKAQQEEAQKAAVEEKEQDTTSDALIPCDCLILRGSAVVNESSLTGESVPQMKEAIKVEKKHLDADENDVNLEMNGTHRVSVLFSGTSLVTVDPDEIDSTSRVPPTPDGGVLAYALRTGFSSSQGTLVQMIEFSQQSVTGDLRETGLALLLLLFFALAAAAYVLKEGLEKKEKTTHELLLKCVIIITSVVPRQFPMQMAMAVNMALMALTKGGIFCTEQFRVPLAGKITHCLFDKTGTLTTDQLVPVGVVNYDSRIHKQEFAPPIEKVNCSCEEAAMILAGCHSLVEVEAEDGTMRLAGDPIELAAIQGIEWDWNSSMGAATPGVYAHMEKAIKALEAKVAEISREGLANPTTKARAEQDIANLKSKQNNFRTKIAEAKRKAEASSFSAIRISARHHFSSALQRMSVVAKCSMTSGGMCEWYSLVKGSPEAIGKLFKHGSMPSWYNITYEKMARKGLRVLALAYKRLPDTTSDSVAASMTREDVESDLLFGGFIAFECKIRADSGIVVKSLTDSHHAVSMLTGDGLLTSLHVAKEVNICDKKMDCLTLAAGSNTAHWVVDEEPSVLKNTEKRDIPLEIEGITDLAKTYNLITTEAEFMKVINATGGETSPLWNYCGFFRVFARMSPQGKASVIKSIQDSSKDNCVLMCGDGGNDVGALKQANVGMALLSGHANANTTDSPIEEESPETAIMKSDTDVAGSSAEDALNKHQDELKRRSEELNKMRAEHMKAFQAKYQKEAQARLQEKVKELTEKGDYMGMWNAMKGQATDLKVALNKENARFMAMHGGVWDPKKDDTGGDGGIMDMMGGMEDASAAAGLPMIRPGDASVAAPFTSRTPSVRAVIDLIRQGRCTLLSALMQQQIMMLESIIAAYTLSALSLHNARSSERQMMASSWLIMTAAVAFSYSSPLDHMHPLRPLRSLFHPAIFISTMGQAFIHIMCMNYAVSMATDVMGPDGMREVTEFFKKAKAKEILAVDMCDEDDIMCQFQAYWTAPFLPNLLNTTVFLVETAQMISVFFANYKGRPWMKGMLENHALFLSVFLCIGGVVVASWEMVPQLNDMIQLAPFPDDGFRYKVVGLVMATIAGTFLWDRFCTMIFAPKIAAAMVKEAVNTKPADLLPVVMTFAKVCAGVFLLGTGNILLAGLMYWVYKRQSTTQVAKVEKKTN